MLIYDARGEWFFGQSDDLRGFFRTGQVVNGKPVTYAEPSLFLTGEVKPYAKIGDLVCRLLDIADDGWKTKVFEQKRLLLDAVEAAVND